MQWGKEETVELQRWRPCPVLPWQLYHLCELIGAGCRVHLGLSTEPRCFLPSLTSMLPQNLEAKLDSPERSRRTTRPSPSHDHENQVVFNKQFHVSEKTQDGFREAPTVDSKQCFFTFLTDADVTSAKIHHPLCGTPPPSLCLPIKPPLP